MTNCKLASPVSGAEQNFRQLYVSSTCSTAGMASSLREAAVALQVVHIVFDTIPNTGSRARVTTHVAL